MMIATNQCTLFLKIETLEAVYGLRGLENLFHDEGSSLVVVILYLS